MAKTPSIARLARVDGGAAGEPAARCERLARGGGALRRELAAAAATFTRVRGWERLGFARLSDYAVERLGISGRELQDLARGDAALASLPRVSEALVAGRLSWTKVRLLARVATPEDEARWLALAKALSARELAREVRRLDVESIENAGPPGFAGGGERDPPRETARLRCTPRVRAKWHRTRLLANRVSGRSLTAWECAEAVAAEVLSAMPLDPAEVPALEADIAPGSEAEARPRLPRLERRSRAAGSGVAVEEADAFALDAALRALVTREQRAEPELAHALLEVAETRGHRARGFPTLDAYVREELGLSPRRARMLMRLARAARRVPSLGKAWRSGVLSFLRAYAIAPVLVAAPRHAGGWIERARSAPCVRVEEEAEAALVMAEVDPEGFAACGGLAARAGAGEEPSEGSGRQAGAQPTAAEGTVGAAETAHLLLNGPRDAIRLFRATSCSVRRCLERRTGRCPTPGEALEAMLDHAITEWQPRRSRRERRAQRIYERDGWRCTVPACTSYRNQHDHHIVFRSRGGSDADRNRTTLCAWHHLRGVHAGRVRCTGSAPHALRFELGLRAGRPPLLVFRSSR